MLLLKSISALTYTVRTHFCLNLPAAHFYLLLDIEIYFVSFVSYLWITVSAR